MIFTALFTGVIIILGVLAAFTIDFHWLAFVFQNDAVHDLIISGPWAAIIFVVRIIAIWRLYKWGNDYYWHSSHESRTIVAVPIGVICSLLFWGMLYLDGFFGSYVYGAQKAVFSLPLEVNILFAYLWIIVCEKLYDFLLWAEINKEEIKKMASDLWKRLSSIIPGYDISGLLLFLILIATGAILISGLWQLMKHDDLYQVKAGALVESSWTQLYPANVDETSTEPKEVYTNIYSAEEPYCIDDIAIVWGNYWFVPAHPDKSYKTTENEYTEWITKRYGEPNKVFILADNEYVDFGDVEVWNTYGWFYLGDYPCVLSAYPYP